jgi:hypothetical protein
MNNTPYHWLEDGNCLELGHVDVFYQGQMKEYSNRMHEWGG